MKLAGLLAEERRARLAAERLLELKQAELFAANRKLGMHAKALSHQITETRAEVETVRSENQRVRSDLTQAQNKVEIAERRLWHSIEAIRDGFAFFDADGTLITANHAYFDLFDGMEEVAPGVGYARILQVLTDEGIVNTDTLAPRDWRSMMMERWRQDEPDLVVIRLWNDQYLRVQDQRGPDGSMISLCIDITDSVQVEERLRLARERAEAANRAKSAFLANMSHELRTPMNGIVGMTDILSDTTLDADQTLYVDTIRRSGEALLVIINDVLDYSKIEAGKMVLVPQPFDLERMIHDILFLVQVSASAKKLAMLVDYDLFLPSDFVGDQGRIRQVLTNLVGNAVKFTKEGQVTVRVTGFEVGRDRYELHIVVEDTGIGIPEEQQARVFGEFNQVDDAQNRLHEGTGLGLAISQRLIQMMGGEIWLDSTPGRGSSFGLALTLPMAGRERPPPQALPSSLQRIVLVECHIATRQLLSRQLSAVGRSVVEIGSGTQALDLDPGQRIDAYLIEQDLPDMDGFDLAGKLRAKGVTAPILLVSEQPGQIARAAGHECVDATLQKPVSRLELFRKLASLKGGNRSLPAPAPDAPASPATPAERPEPLLDVLLAEDNKTNQLIFRKMVGEGRCTLRFANDGFEAVDEVRRAMPDLVFMDISMPGMDGKEATRRIRALPGADALPIIAVTAHALADDRAEILAAGLTDYLTKPLRKAALHKMLDRYAAVGSGRRRRSDEDRTVGL